MKALLPCLAVALVALFACSGSSGDASTPPSDSGEGFLDAPSHDGTSLDAAGDSSATETSADSFVTADSSTTSDALSDAGDPLAPHPPAGSTKCGEGTFTPGDAASACMKPSYELDDALLPDGGHGSTPRRCDALSVDGGRWEVWCGSKTYVWARFDGVTNTAALHDCHGASLIMIDLGVYQTGSIGGNTTSVRTYQDPYGEIAGSPPGVKQTAIFTLDLSAWPSGSSVTGDLFLLGSLEDTCSGGAMQPPVVLSGVAVKWKTP